MRHRWVLIYCVFCLGQIPLYLWLGTGPQGYDFAIKRAEVALSRAPVNLPKVEEGIETAEERLREIPEQDSREARWEHNRALLYWFQGKMAEADASFRKSIAVYEATHGPDAWHTVAVSLRYGEFLMDSRRYQEAMEHFETGTRAIDEVQGPNSPFAVRMNFRHVMLLNYLGRTEEAISKAELLLPHLKSQAHLFDVPFINQVSGTLDALTRQGGLPSPGNHSWSRTLLDEAKRLRDQDQGLQPGD